MFTSFENSISVTIAPKNAGIITEKLRRPIPSTNGVYNPNGIRSVEKLIPGTITLTARHKPQKTYHIKLGSNFTRIMLSPMISAKIIMKAAIKEITENLFRPFFPASLSREGNMPIVVFDMNRPGNLTALLRGEKVGTVVHA